MKLKNLLPIFCFFLVSFSISSAQKCGKTGLFKPNDKYDINRHLLLSSLASNVSARGGFYNASIGQGPDRLYASGTCIQGSEPELCSACIDSAFIRVIKKCHNQTEALDWSSFNEEYPCMIRYSNRSFFGLLEMTPFFKNYNATDFQVNLTEFYQKWEALMLGVIADAISSPNPKFYGAGTGKIGIQTVYAFVLCSKDISPWNCSRCLRGNVDNYKLSCSGKPRGHSFSPSCYMRWDLYQFYGFIEYRASPTLPREKGRISELSDGTSFLVSYFPLSAIIVGDLALFRWRKDFYKKYPRNHCCSCLFYHGTACSRVCSF